MVRVGRSTMLALTPKRYCAKRLLFNMPFGMIVSLLRSCSWLLAAAPNSCGAEDVRHRVELGRVAVAQADHVEQELLVPRLAHGLVVLEAVAFQGHRTEGAAGQAQHQGADGARGEAPHP